MRAAPSSVRLDIARAAFEQVTTQLPMDNPVVRQYLEYFTSGRPVPENDEVEEELGDDPLEIVSSQYRQEWVRTRSDKDFRRYESVAALGWAANLTDGNQSLANLAADETVYRALLTFAEDLQRRESILSILRQRLEIS